MFPLPVVCTKFIGMHLPILCITVFLSNGEIYLIFLFLIFFIPPSLAIVPITLAVNLTLSHFSMSSIFSISAVGMIEGPFCELRKKIQILEPFG